MDLCAPRNTNELKIALKKWSQKVCIDVSTESYDNRRKKYNKMSRNRNDTTLRDSHHFSDADDRKKSV